MFNSESWESSIEERVHGNIQSTVLSGLNPDTFYSFRVQAENSLGSGYPSPVQSIRTSQDAPSGAPEQVSVKPTSSQSLLVTWRAPKPELRHGLIQGYNIFYASLESTDIQEPYTVCYYRRRLVSQKEKIGTRFELKGLRKFTEYSIYLEAYNQVGTSPKSSPSVIARTLEDAPSAPPNRVECSGLDSTSLQVSWFEPSPVHIHGLLQGYFIFYSPLLEWEESPSVENLTTRARSEKISGLARWQNYTVSVSAYNRAGLGVRSRPIYCSTLESLPGAPANIKTISVSSNSVLVTWLPPIHPNGRITLYKVYMKTMLEGQPFTELTEVYPSETSKVFEKLNPGQPYSWSVTALTIVGEGPRSDTVTETPLYQGEKGPEMLGFSKFLIQAEGDNLELSCRNIGNPPARIDWEYKTNFVFARLSGDKLENIEMSRGGRPRSLRFDSLRVENSGNYTCSATNKLGGAQIFYSLQVKLSRSNGVVPYPPTLRIVTVNQTSITLSWDTHPTGGSSILNYRIYFRREAGSWEEKYVSISSFSPTIYPYLETVGNLKCGSRHFFQISATNDFGTSSRSTEISTLTLGSPPIAPPQEKLLYMNPGSNLVLLLESWKDGGCPISSFVVEYREGSQDWHLLSNLLSPETKRKD
ncbi:Down syndrome cell adhesion molecule-like protein Dscam2 [Eurytemora carolleeae]|uniref:Down syndrome cell adhesion molecule-like protein Dscam2 n=1 Tax=Eurytemora carolleeae TaxID=1294199 RepID=UPI000C7674D0|nr:Down syndrome cell adhesion molecule-like protein Dscam2 [Eurytemora carolleeae]|eukprot:XP_023335203.1 Down syndrome cell adhesion molecule-like protein Dscam2 [Eurytemora affinis]